MINKCQFLKLAFLISLANLAQGQIPVGNFALPVALQPSPLFSFGQNTLDYNDKLLYVNPIYLKGKKKSFFENETYFLYGLSDRASLFALLPAPVINRQNKLEETGFGDVIIQYEYAFINQGRLYDQIQSTVVASIYLPSGIVELAKEGPGVPSHGPFTGLGSTSFFLGWTYSYTSIDWYSFLSVGELFTTTRSDNTKLGNSTLYQAGIGYNLKHLHEQILLLLFEFDGIYTKRDRLLGLTDPNSGGNIMYLGPVLYYANTRIIFQVGIQAPIYQKLHGIQPKNSYLFSISLAYLFNHDEYAK